MADIFHNVIIWVVGFVFLIIILLLINGLIFLVNRFVKGSKRIDALTLVIPSEGINQYAPTALTQFPDGRIQINPVSAILKLFNHVSDVLSESELRRWAKEGKLHMSFYLQPGPANADEVAQIAISGLLRSGFPLERLKKSKVYSISSNITPQSEKAYVVVIGNIPTSMPFIILPSFD